MRPAEMAFIVHVAYFPSFWGSFISVNGLQRSVAFSESGRKRRFKRKRRPGESGH